MTAYKLSTHTLFIVTIQQDTYMLNQCYASHKDDQCKSKLLSHRGMDLELKIALRVDPGSV